MSIVTIITKSLVLDIVKNIIYFPVWWYTRGLKKRFLGLINGTGTLAHNLALKIMFKYLLRPMFGERSKSGRIISFFMRLILLSWRLFLFFLGVIGLLLILIIWIILPVIAIWQIIMRISF